MLNADRALWLTPLDERLALTAHPRLRQAESELPERIFGTCHYSKMNLQKLGLTLPPRGSCGDAALGERPTR